MNPRILIIVFALLGVAGGAVFLATRNVPAPHHVIEKIISNDRFFK